MVTYRELLKTQTERLTQAGNDNALFDCAELMGKALGADCRSGGFESLLDRSADSSLQGEFEALCDRRIGGEPLQYILGEWEFYGMTLKVGKGTLIPRQDTETLVDIAVDMYKNSDGITVIDLCSGSGCIALALERYLKAAAVYAVEKSEEAAEFLRKNIELHSSAVRSAIGDVREQATADSLPAADLIVCNPPYLTAEDMAALQKEVTHEPSEALFGGDDGLDFYRDITRIWKHKLKAGGRIIYEIGAGQEDEVMGILVQHGFENVRCKPDACGVMRCVTGMKKL